MCTYIRFKSLTLFLRILIKMIIMYHRQFEREREVGIPNCKKQKHSFFFCLKIQMHKQTKPKIT